MGKQERTGIKTYPPPPKPKTKKQKSPNGITRLIDRYDCAGWMFSFRKSKHFCRHCRSVWGDFGSGFKSWSPDLCPNCKNILVDLPLKARVPRKNASNYIWNKFFKLFPSCRPKE